MRGEMGLPISPGEYLRWLLPSGGALTLHRVLHVLRKEVPHHLGADLPHVQLLGEPGAGGQRGHKVLRA